MNQLDIMKLIINNMPSQTETQKRLKLLTFTCFISVLCMIECSCYKIKKLSESF